LEKNRETLPAFTCCIVNGHMVYHGIAQHPMYYFGGFGATDGTEATWPDGTGEGPMPPEGGAIRAPRPLRLST
jgi:hypothetical protein